MLKWQTLDNCSLDHFPFVPGLGLVLWLACNSQPLLQYDVAMWLTRSEVHSFPVRPINTSPMIILLTLFPAVNVDAQNNIGSHVLKIAETITLETPKSLHRQDSFSFIPSPSPSPYSHTHLHTHKLTPIR